MDSESLSSEQLQRLLGEVARSARARLGLTQAQVALRVGLVPNVYGRIERGGMMPAVPTLRRLARVLELSTDALLLLREEDVAASVHHPLPEVELSGDLRQLMVLVRGWRPAKVKQLLRVLRLLEAPLKEV
ncbi:helix-turn-helix domain-containing protein [Melittangium boletus]|uniref:DNA-binding protein n=1 Tax=Melittangium boletus DSM 14713 TaxID=1294270 RepID=A0A250IE59_9BACT|nr:helix-turn-helix transcriptional regulator [Melittangium boletus]ATB30055.1 DNA-binding protein [Melittangium boletus DSM 14713]